MVTKASRWLALGLVTIASSGCYLGHVAAGQARLLWARRPIDAMVRDPATTGDLRDRLERVLAVRAYAAGLGLAVQDRYRDYAPWPGDRVVTTVVATRPGEVEAAGFWFPIVGRVPYKGYFDPVRAEREAERLRGQGLDVCMVPVRAYSTLGWFDDPVTGPMLRQPDGAMVETLFHELVHATTFVADQPEFNEGVASFVGEEARLRFFAATEGPAAATRERQRVEEQRRLRAALLALRQEVAELYLRAPAGPARSEARRQLERDARTRAATLLASPGRDPVAAAAALRLNDACLALTATYSADSACYAAALAAEGGDLARFVARLRTSAVAEDPRSVLIGPGPCAAAPLAARPGALPGPR